jgi:hypothetical protein
MARRNNKTTADDVAAARNSKDPVQVLAGIVLCLCAIAPTNAWAYLDPGTGTFALQGLIAGIAGGVISIRTCWRRIGGLFRRSKTSSETWSGQQPPGGDA